MTQLSTLLHQSLDPAAAGPSPLDNALLAVRRHLNMPVAYLSAFHRDQVIFVAVSTDDPTCPLKAGTRQAAAGTYCQAVRDGILPELIPDTGALDAAQAMAVTQALPVGAIVSVPILRRDGSVYGMFCCLSHVPKPDLNLRDHEMMKLFASVAADSVNDRLDSAELSATLKRRITDMVIDRDFSIALQPIVDLPTGRVVGAEALTRFRPKPYRSPDAWFAEAATVGLGTDLELTTLDKALELLRHLPERQTLSLNLSPQALLTPELSDVLMAHACARIALEITEHAAFADFVALRRGLARLRDIGVRIAIDDVGAGYAGLHTILQLKPDILKLDRTLVRGVHMDMAGQSMVQAMIYFADQIGAILVAEGVETSAETACLRDMGVHRAQGYLFGRPGPLGDHLSASIRTFPDA